MAKAVIAGQYVVPAGIAIIFLIFFIIAHKEELCRLINKLIKKRKFRHVCINALPLMSITLTVTLTVKALTMKVSPV